VYVMLSEVEASPRSPRVMCVGIIFNTRKMKGVLGLCIGVLGLQNVTREGEVVLIRRDLCCCVVRIT
jgi:hypothetical protein